MLSNDNTCFIILGSFAYAIVFKQLLRAADANLPAGHLAQGGHLTHFYVYYLFKFVVYVTRKYSIMFEDFEHYLKHQLPELTDKQLARIQSISVSKTLPRRYCLLQEGEICNQKIFVSAGLLRNFSAAEDGNEYNMKFTAECEWTTDSESYHNRTPCHFSIETIEPSKIIIWTHEDFEQLRQEIPLVNVLSNQLIAKVLIDSQKRVLVNISATAEEKYLDFMSSFPHIHRRLPLHMIASYLGVSRETLTRIRHAQLTR